MSQYSYWYGPKIGIGRNLVQNGIDPKLVWTENWYGPKFVTAVINNNNVIETTIAADELLTDTGGELLALAIALLYVLMKDV